MVITGKKGNVLFNDVLNQNLNNLKKERYVIRQHNTI